MSAVTARSRSSAGCAGAATTISISSISSPTRRCSRRLTTRPVHSPEQLAPDGRAIYLSSDKDRDRSAFARIRIEGGKISPPEVVAGRDDGELSGFEITDQGTTAALLWNVAGRNELAFVDSRFTTK